MPDNRTPPVEAISSKHGNPKTRVSPPHQNPPLGIGPVFRDTFSIVRRHILPILAIGLVAAIASWLSYTLMGPFQLRLDLPSVLLARLVLYATPQIAIFAMIAAFVVRQSYNAKLGRPATFKGNILPTIISAVILTVLGAILESVLLGSMFLTLYLGVVSTVEAIILFRAGFWLLLWLSAPISFVIAIVVIEQSVIRSPGRTLALTKNRRWIVAAAFYLSVFSLFLFRVGYGFLFAWIAGRSGVSEVKFLSSIFDGLGLVIFSILITMIYARLREIEEGIGTERIDAVFD